MRTDDQSVPAGVAARSIALVAAVIAGLLLAAPASAAGPTSLAGLRASLNARMVNAGPRSGAFVVDLSTGRTLYDVRSRTRLVPASLEKLYTTSAALMALGPNARLSTAVLGAGRRVGASWEGDIYLRGSGDFTFGSASFNRRAYGGGGTLQALALRLQAQGITQVKGSVLGDASLFADGHGPSFSQRLCAKPLFGSGCPYGPAGKFRRPLPNGPRSAVTADRGLVNSTSTRTQIHPALFAAGQLVGQLRRAGISVTGHPGVGRAPRSSQVLATTSSPTVAQMAALTNRPSDDYAAEMIFRVLGAHLGHRLARLGGGCRQPHHRPALRNPSAHLQRVGRVRAQPDVAARARVAADRDDEAACGSPVCELAPRRRPLGHVVGSASPHRRRGPLSGPGRRPDGAAGRHRRRLLPHGRRAHARVRDHDQRSPDSRRSEEQHGHRPRVHYRGPDADCAGRAPGDVEPRTAGAIAARRPGGPRQLGSDPAAEARQPLCDPGPPQRRLDPGQLGRADGPRPHAERLDQPRPAPRSQRAASSVAPGPPIVRSATVRFKVTPNRALVGAGRDRFVVVGQPVDLRGRSATGREPA